MKTPIAKAYAEFTRELHKGGVLPAVANRDHAIFLAGAAAMLKQLAAEGSLREGSMDQVMEHLTELHEAVGSLEPSCRLN
jgi:hypothetical protein